jgi:hypothetical protein
MSKLHENSTNQPSDTPIPSLFLSYARGDDEPFVKRLYHRLTSIGFNVWWDREKMPSRSLTFLQEIREAIRNAERVIVVIGPKAVKSDYVRAEWQAALVENKVVVPVLRLGTHELLPRELKALHCPDLRADRNWDEGVAELIRVLHEPIPPSGKLLGDIPLPPPHFQPRPTQLTQLAEAVLLEAFEPVTLSAPEMVMIVHGIAGVGKTVLTAAFARASTTRRSFRDGVVWLSADPNLEALAIVQQLGNLLSDSSHFYTSISSGITRLRDTLENKKILLIIDNAWSVEQIEPILSALGVYCRLLVTTRGRELADAVGARSLEIGVLTEEEAHLQLADWAGVHVKNLPQEAKQVARECGYLPFAVALNGGMAKAGNTWGDLLSALLSTQLDFAQKRMAGYPYENVIKSVRVSIDFLARENPKAAKLYKNLAVLKLESGVPEAAVCLLWNYQVGLTDGQCRRLLTQLEGKAMLRLIREGSQWLVSLHDLQLDYLRAALEDDVSANQVLLAAYRQKCPNDWPSGPNDGYFHQHLVDHLFLAEQEAEVHRLLKIRDEAGRNAWYEAHAANGSLSSFTADVRQAWRKSKQHARSEIRQRQMSVHMPLELRYALMCSSAGSLARGLPPSLLPAVASAQNWRPSDTIAYVNQISEPEQRVEAFVAILPSLPAESKKEALSDALASIRKIRDDYWRAGALARILPELPQSLLDEARKLAEEIDDPKQRKAALARVSSVQNGIPLLEGVPKDETTDKDFQELSNLAAQLTRYITQQEEATFRLIPALKSENGFSMTCLEQARSIEDSTSRAQALAALIPLLPEDQRAAVEQEALEAVSNVGDVQAQSAAYMVLANRLAKLGYADEALLAAQSQSSAEDRVVGLATLLPLIPASVQQATLNMAQAELSNVEDQVRRDVATGSLATGLAACANTTEALKMIEEIRSSLQEIYSLIALLEELPVSQHPPISIRAYRELQALRNDRDWALAVIRAAPHLGPDQISAELVKAQKLKDRDYCYHTVMVLAPQLAVQGAVEEAFAAIMGIGDENWRNMALVGLARKLADNGLVPKAVEAACSISNIAWHSEILAEMIGWGVLDDPESLMDEVFATIDPDEAPEQSAYILCRVIPHLDAPTQKTNVELLKTLVSKIPEVTRPLLEGRLAYIIALSDSVENSIDILDGISNERWRAKAIADIASLTQERNQVSLLLATARTIKEPRYRIMALGALLPQMSNCEVLERYEVWSELLELLSVGTRFEMLSQFAILIDTMFAVGGAETIKAALAALNDVCSYWP